MMAIEMSRDFGKQLCSILGLDSSLIHNITIGVKPDGVLITTTRHLTTIKQAKEILKVTKHYELTPIRKLLDEPEPKTERPIKRRKRINRLEWDWGIYACSRCRPNDQGYTVIKGPGVLPTFNCGTCKEGATIIDSDHYRLCKKENDNE